MAGRRPGALHRLTGHSRAALKRPMARTKSPSSSSRQPSSRSSSSRRRAVRDAREPAIALVGDRQRHRATVLGVRRPLDQPELEKRLDLPADGALVDGEDLHQVTRPVCHAVVERHQHRVGDGRQVGVVLPGPLRGPAADAAYQHDHLVLECAQGLVVGHAPSLQIPEAVSRTRQQRPAGVASGSLSGGRGRSTCGSGDCCGVASTLVRLAGGLLASSHLTRP